MSLSLENESVIKNRIIDSAEQQFFVHGFTKVTMDEIASHIGISKKTIYKHYQSKTDLVNAMADKMLGETEEGFRKIVEDTQIDFLEKISKMMTFVAVHLSKLSRPLIEDIQHNAPQLWKKISDFRMKRIHEDFRKLIKEGREKHMLRVDIDEQLVMLIYMNLIENIIRPDILSELPLTASQAYEAIAKVVFEGMLTDEAKIHLKTLAKTI